MLYKQFMAGHFDQFEYKGKTFSAKPFKRKEPKVYVPRPRSEPSAGPSEGKAKTD